MREATAMRSVTGVRRLLLRYSRQWRGAKQRRGQWLREFAWGQRSSRIKVEPGPNRELEGTPAAGGYWLTGRASSAPRQRRQLSGSTADPRLNAAERLDLTPNKPSPTRPRECQWLQRCPLISDSLVSLAWIGEDPQSPDSVLLWLRSPSMSRPREEMLRIAAALALLVANSSPALTDCRAEVEIAFQKLQMPGRAYRRVTTMASIVHVADTRGVQVFRETVEFILPDRKTEDIGLRRRPTFIRMDPRRPAHLDPYCPPL